MRERIVRALKAPFTGKHVAAPTHRNPQKRKKSLPKRWPRRRGVVPQTQPPTSLESMHPELSSLWAVKDRQVASASRTRVSQPLEATTRLGANCCMVFDLGMTWKARDDMEGWLGIWLDYRGPGRPTTCCSPTREQSGGWPNDLNGGAGRPLM